MMIKLNLLAYKVMATSNAQHIAYIIHKPCSLSFSVRALTPLIQTENLNPLTSLPFHQVFWSNSAGKLQTLKVILYKKKQNNDSCKTVTGW
jgi:hypothetical protein